MVGPPRGGSSQSTVVTHKLAGSAYIDELCHFHDCVTLDSACRNTAREAQYDIAFLRSVFMTLGASGALPPAPIRAGSPSAPPAEHSAEVAGALRRPAAVFEPV